MSIMLLAAIIVGLVILAGIAAFFVSLTSSEEKAEKAKYQYTAKRSIMTAAEQDFYNALGMAVGQEYRIFARVSLGSILDEKVKGQNWKAARSHINRKSVDFLLCDKEYLSPKLAIELDDKTHEREDRVERDIEVERILKAAGIPLLRVQNNGNFDPVELTGQVQAVVGE